MLIPVLPSWAQQIQTAGGIDGEVSFKRTVDVALTDDVVIETGEVLLRFLLQADVESDCS
jgi:hypothetical protein